MDKAVHTLLAVGIAVLYPVLVLFAVMTVIADKSAPQPQAPVYPTYPNCTSSFDDYSQPIDLQSDIDNTPIYEPFDSCASQQAEYDQQVAQYGQKEKDYQKQYDEWQKQDNKDMADRATLALVMSIITICLVAFIREYKELAAGLVAGATLTIIGSISLLFEYLGTTNIVKAPIAVIAVSFVALTGVMYWLEKHIEETRLGPLPQTPIPAHPPAHPPIPVPIHPPHDSAPVITHTPADTPPPPVA